MKRDFEKNSLIPWWEFERNKRSEEEENKMLQIIDYHTKRTFNGCEFWVLWMF